MSLENNLKRIADALEELVKQGETSFAEKAAEAGLTDAVGSIEQTRTAAPAPAPAPAPQQEAAAAPAPMTPEALNAALVAEFNRLGDRTPIDNVLKEMGVTGVTELPAERYQELLNKVKAIPNG